MKFYTVQSQGTMKRAREKGVYSSDKKHWFEPKAYPWMIEKYNEKLKKSAESLLWLWDKKPNVDGSGWGETGKVMELIEVELDEQEVVLSEFGLWHYVLNGWTIQLYENEDIEMEKSWERIFDKELCESSEYLTCKRPEWQYVAGEVPVEKMKVLKVFKCKE